MSTMQTLIRPMKQRDLDAIVDMIGALAVHHGHAPNISAQQLAAESLGSRPSLHVAVAEAAGRLVGYAVLHTHFVALSGTRTGNLDHLFVVTEHRGRGIGRRLVDAAIETARNLGCDSIEVQAVTQNWAAQEIYVALGFEPLHYTRRYYGRSI
jgi:ribosomal protein S18 acetylase RimI-like enzyme